MTDEKRELTEEEEQLARQVANERAALMVANDFIPNYQQRIHDMHDAIWADVKALGNYYPQRSLPGIVQKYTPVLPAEHCTLFCLATYSTSLKEACATDDLPVKDPKGKSILGNEIGCYSAVGYYTSTNPKMKEHAQSLWNFQPTEKGAEPTLGQMLKEGYLNGTIKPGALVMVQSTRSKPKKDDPLPTHAVMFMGLDKEGHQREKGFLPAISRF
ncbi:MAG: hypothetical protein J6Y09_08580, partial [Lachnospiraceae bacterium]|nr:hypothetical protein [Lachnospiraceae bacterium]